jgi:hypothetical protein
MSDGFKSFVDWLATGIGLAVFAKLIPMIAGIFSILWLGTCLYKEWFGKGVTKRGSDGDE